MTAEYWVEVSRTVFTQVRVQAASAEAAVELVNQRDYPLPPVAEWSAHKDWRYKAWNVVDETDSHEED